MQLFIQNHYTDVIMGTIVSQITSLTIVYSTVYSDAAHRKYQSSASLAFVRGIHRRPANSPHKWPVTRTMFPFDDVIMYNAEKVRTVLCFSNIGKFIRNDCYYCVIPLDTHWSLITEDSLYAYSFFSWCVYWFLKLTEVVFWNVNMCNLT